MRAMANIQHAIDPLAPFRPSTVGLFRETVCVNGRNRHYLVYIPTNVRSSTSGVFVFADHGVTAQELYEKSNWADLAETDERKEKFIVFYLESENGAWKLNDPAEDLAYVRAVFEHSRGREKYCVHEAKYYLTGCGEGGTMAQMAAMDNPALYAGVASIESPAVSEEFIEEIGNSPCPSLDGYEDPEGRYGYQKKDFTVPAWIIATKSVNEAAEIGAARYWRNAAGTAEKPIQLRPDVLAYIRETDAPWTVNQEKEAFRVWVSAIPGAANDYGNAVNRRIWAEFLRNVQRWMAEPGGDLRVTKDPVLDLGMEYHYELIDGWMREYYVYVPKRLRGNEGEPVPLVFAMHGYTCSGEIYSGNSEWHKVAEDNGFIVVFPSAAHGYLRSGNPDNPAVGPNDTELPAWNVLDFAKVAPDELAFFDEMIERVCASHKIDRSRIFATGHSLGSLMTQLLGMARPDVFAAIAPCSGVLFLNAAEGFPKKPAVQNRAQAQLPIWMFGGENEEWLLEAIPVSENQTGQSVYVWMDLNQMTGEKPADFEAYRGAENGRWNDYLFYEGKIPMIRYTWVAEMPHATMTEMSYRIWNEFFSKISRAEDGSVVYDG